jgi:hypothetical protein
MLHKCEKCDGDAILFRQTSNEEPKTLCSNWHCWDVAPTNPEEINGGVDPAVSESAAMMKEILQVFDNHLPFLTRIFATRSLNQDRATDWMVHLMTEAIFNMYFSWWPRVKDIRAIRNAILPHIVRAMDDTINYMIAFNESQKPNQERPRLDA